MINEAPWEERTTVVCTVVAGDCDLDVLAQESYLRLIDIGEPGFVLRGSSGQVTVAPDGPPNAQALHYLTANLKLAKVTQTLDGELSRLTLDVFAFPAAHQVGRWRIGVDRDAAIQFASDLRIDANNVTDWLQDQFALPDGTGQMCLFGLATPDGGDNPETAQRLLGTTHFLDIVSAQGIPYARRLGRMQTRSDSAVAYVGDVTFTTDLAEAEGDGANLLRVTTQAYLSLWTEYSTKERELVEARTAEIGSLRYTIQGSTSEVLEVKIDGRDRKRGHLLMDAVAAGFDRVELPVPAHPGRSGRGRNQQFKVLNDSTSDRLRLQPASRSDLDELPAPDGELRLSMQGDLTRLQRRDDARHRVQSMKALIPDLARLLEDGSVIGPRKPKSLPRLAPVLQAHFEGAVTPSQREALRVALETPDIALIQGPPGTGKTRVIAALVDVLSSASGNSRGERVLVASEQNEAVHLLEETVESRMGIPPFSIGERYTSSLQWSRNLAAHLDERWADLPRPALVRELRELQSRMEAGGVTVGAVAALGTLDNLLETFRAYREPAPREAGSLRKRIRQSAAELVEQSPTLAYGATIRRVHALPDTVEAFADGGRDLVRSILDDRRLRAALSSAEREALIPITADTSPESIRDQAVLVGQTKQRLLDRLQAPEGRPERDWCHEVLQVIESALSQAESNLTVEDQIALIALDLADTLLWNPAQIEHTHLSLTSSFTATNQKSVSRWADLAMTEYGGLSFDTVIIDEAARANPLDLLIPMSLATRRIVLVGDHRQLPQMLEPDVEKDLTSNLSDDLTRALKESLFERLIRSVREKDSENRTKRVVTLNRQFRMHPWLGEFLSDAFYVQDGGILSPEDPSPYIHSDTRYSGKPGVWIDCTGEGEQRVDSSWMRRTEAERCAELAQHWLAECPESTVGVMSLYAAQSRAILAAMTSLKTPDGTSLSAVDEKYDRLDVHPDLVDRLRVGNVDAFQGREFDHVALSLVRSNSYSNARRAFGYLALPNRLCVAMSRQRRLLAVLGDRSRFKGELADEAVPALSEFLRRCEEHHAVY